jgi:pimeloyl-ACP methyl ester carboxylesterase
VERDVIGLGGRLAAEAVGEGRPVVGLHGLTATRRYVLMGSRILERAGYEVVLYDARGHGGSAAPRDGDYSYGALAADLGAVLDSFEFERPILVGASMGAHTALRFALDHPERVAGLVIVTPGYDPGEGESRLVRWDSLSRALREGGIDAFLEAYELSSLPEAWRATIRTVIAQRLAQHDDLGAVADALAAVPRSRPFDDYAQLATVTAPALVIGSRDEADPEHPLALASAYAAALANAELLVEDPGRGPIAWQGGQISRAIAAVGDRARAL